IVGLGFRKSSSGKLSFVAANVPTTPGLKFFVAKTDGPTNSPTTPVNPAGLMLVSSALWLKVQDDNTNLKYFVGDGIDWIELYSEARGVYMTGGPDQVMFCANNFNNSFDMLVKLISWSVG